jgi:hypothetical protein
MRALIAKEAKSNFITDSFITKINFIRMYLEIKVEDSIIVIVD